MKILLKVLSSLVAIRSDGDAGAILLRSRDGRRVNLPAHHLRPFIGHDGVHGTFRLDFSKLSFNCTSTVLPIN